MSVDSLSRRALALFDDAMELSERERDQWIAANCAGDTALEEELRGLLSAAGTPNGILDAPAHLPAASGVATVMRDAFAHAYDIQRELGKGGMATVFHAREVKHDRDVVIKVMSGSVSRVYGAERFLREVRIAATLAHPHIVPLIDSGSANGYLYYVMPFMGGESLRDRLSRGKPPLSESVRILRDIAGALAFAHESGVVHRDLKPENVLLTGGHAYLLDFGIAKLVNDTTTVTNISLPGFTIGTRRYMAPEQDQGTTEVDARADIYAFALMGAELLTGVPVPLDDAYAQVKITLRNATDIPPAIVQLLTQSLAVNREMRPRDMREVLSRLDVRLRRAATPRRVSWRRIAIGATLGAFAVAAIGYASNRAPTLLQPGLREPVAVSAFRNETGDTSLAVIGRFAGDWVTDGLQRLGVVKVVPWSEALLASEHADQTRQPVIATLQKETLAGTVITGSFYKHRDSLHVQAQVTDARTGTVISTLAPIVMPVDRPESGINELRDRVLGAIATVRDERVSSLPGVMRSPPSLSAYQAFDKGFDRFISQRYDDALADFREAYKRDTTFSMALLMAARAAWNTSEFAAAESLVTQTRSRGRELGVYEELSLRYIEAQFRGDGLAARSASQRAALMAPNSRAGYDYAVALLSSGEARKADQQLRLMDPNRGEMRGWSSYWTQRAHTSYLIGDFQSSLDASRELATRHPDRRVAQVLEARALAGAKNVAALDSAFARWELLPADVYWSQGGAMVTAGEELIRQGRTIDGNRMLNRAVSWLSNRLLAEPAHEGHRQWIGLAFYSLEQYETARPYFESLARDFPEKIRYRGHVALIAARRRDLRAVEQLLATAPPRETGELLAFQARAAAIANNQSQSITLLSRALEHGIAGYPWLFGSGYREFALIEADPRGRTLLSAR